MKRLKNIEIVCRSVDCEECKMGAVAVVRENGLKLGRFGLHHHQGTRTGSQLQATHIARLVTATYRVEPAGLEPATIRWCTLHSLVQPNRAN